MSSKRRPRRHRRGEQISVHARLRNASENALFYASLLDTLLDAVEAEAELGTIPESLKQTTSDVAAVLIIHDDLLLEFGR